METPVRRKQRAYQHGLPALLVLASLVAWLSAPALAGASVVNRNGNLITVAAGAGELMSP